MNKEVNVLIVEDDFYARNAMELLLRRDWRTRVFREVGNPADFSKALSDLNKQQAKDKEDGVEKAYLVLIDTDIPLDPNSNWLNETMRNLEKQSPTTRALFTSVKPNAQIVKMLVMSNFAGYVLKDEIRYSLAWAVAYTRRYKLVVTPGVCDIFEGTNPLPHGTAVLDGRNQFAGLSRQDTERARMAFIFSMERHEIANESGITEEYSYGVSSDLFKKIGLNDVLSGEMDPKDYFGDHPSVLAHVEQAIAALQEAEEQDLPENNRGKKPKGKNKADAAKMPKTANKETLAFHLLTLPDIDEIS